MARRILEKGITRQNLSAEDTVRIKMLMEQYSQAQALVARYESRGFRLIQPCDIDWPVQLHKLNDGEPLYLFICGAAEQEPKNTIAVAGSRNIGPEAQRLAARLGRIAAQKKNTLVSGHARGVDRTSQEAALNAGGKLMLFPAVKATDILKDVNYENALRENRLCILSETLPDAEFSASKALSRNHLIYAMGNPALVAAARRGRGGSWRGAMDCLDGKWSPVGVFLGEDPDFDGCKGLIERGAIAVGHESDEEIWHGICRIQAEWQRAQEHQTSFLL